MIQAICGGWWVSWDAVSEERLDAEGDWCGAGDCPGHGLTVQTRWRGTYINIHMYMSYDIVTSHVVCSTQLRLPSQSQFIATIMLIDTI